MNNYSHHVSGFFSNRDAAKNAMTQLLARGLDRDQIQIYETSTPGTALASRNDSNAVLKDVLVDGTIGTAVGTGVGALAQVALLAANVTLLVASPLVAPLVILGWGASMGAVVGATVGAVNSSPPVAPDKESWLSELVSDAIANDQIVLVARTTSESETALAREIIEVAVGDYKDNDTGTGHAEKSVADSLYIK